MASRQRTGTEVSTKQRRPPATSPQARENQLIAAAVDLAEKQIRDGTASAQVISYYLKLGSSREKLEQERLAGEVIMLRAKAEQLESQKRVEDLYARALEAMRSYQGQLPDPQDREYE